MQKVLPETMIAELEKLGMALVDVGKEHRDRLLAKLETEVLTAVRRALPRLLEEVVEVSTTSLHPTVSHWQRECPKCGKPIDAQNWRPRTVTTMCGKITYERPWFSCEICHQGFSPVDQTLEVKPWTRLSEGLNEWLIGLGASMSFAEASEWLDKLTGINVNAETIRQRTECRGNEFEVSQQRASEHVKATRESAEPVDPAPGTLVTETDGVMVRYRDGWHEVKLGVVAGHEEGELRAPSYIATRASVDVFGPRLLSEAARRGALEIEAWEGTVTKPGLAVLREVVILGDGAPWIWNLAAEHFGTRTEIVDFYHASEHIWTVAKALYGEGTIETKTWADERIRELLEQGVKPVRKALDETKAETAEASEVVRLERGYFRTNAARMDYPTFRARGLPIGSGVVESSAKNLVHQRMKRPGARWSQAGAQGVLNVRSRLLSGLPLAC